MLCCYVVLLPSSANVVRHRRHPFQRSPQTQPNLMGSFGHHSQNYIQPEPSYQSLNSNNFGGSGSGAGGLSSEYGHYNTDTKGQGGGGGGGGGYEAVGPVFTFVRTDHHGNFQWGVRHKIGAGGWGR